MCSGFTSIITTGVFLEVITAVILIIGIVFHIESIDTTEALGDFLEFITDDFMNFIVGVLMVAMMIFGLLIAWPFAIVVGVLYLIWKGAVYLYDMYG